MSVGATRLPRAPAAERQYRRDGRVAYRSGLIQSARLVACETRVGRCFEYNYDRHLVDVTAPLFAVVDSECDDGNAGDTVVASLLDARADLIRASNDTPDAIEKVLTEAIGAAHRSIESIPKGARGYGGGASVTVLSVCGDVGIVAHVGDCRLYVRQREGWIRQTEDHTLLEQLRAHGKEPTDPKRELGIITRVVGFPPGSIDTLRFQIATQAEVLLCTRGAWIPTDPIGAAAPLPANLDGTHAAELLLDNYTQSGEMDNATLVLARLGVQ